MYRNNLVHYVWVGNNIPEQFKLNYEATQKLNPNYSFNIWNEQSALPLLGDYTDLFFSASLFHKLQLIKYLVIHHYGGIYSDFDVEWKAEFDNIYSLFNDGWSLIVPKRKSLYFYNRGQKTTMLDDFVIIAKPNVTGQFLHFCQQRTERKDDRTEPFSVYALTEWCLQKNDVQYLTPEQIYDSTDCSLGYHYNKRSW